MFLSIFSQNSIDLNKRLIQTEVSLMVKRNEKTSNIVDQKALVNDKVQKARENNFRGDHIRMGSPAGRSGQGQ